MSKAQSVPSRLRVGVDQKRHHVAFGVPKVVPAVSIARHALGGDAVAAGAGSGLGQLEDVPPHGLLHRRLADDGDVGVLPKGVEPLTLLRVQQRCALLH